jgi:hypothetical protein
LQLKFDDVFAAIESLYTDALKPFGRILRKRVAERAVRPRNGIQNGSVDEALRDVDAKQLRELCEGSDSLQVRPEEGGDWSAIIVGRSETFVDIYSSVDMYTPGMWGAAAAYFQLLSGDNMYLPGGRYSCAQELQARDLAFLQGCSLGRVCHIVQLAISQKKLLGYLNGAAVPYAFSQSMVKEQCAQLNTVCTVSSTASGGILSGIEPATDAAAAKSSLEMATWETARQYLREILHESAKAIPGTVGTVPLSNVKRIFRSRYQTELSETKLGHSKLSDLLQDSRFGDICTVQLQGHGYIVIQVEIPASDTISPEIIHANETHEDPLARCFPETSILNLVQHTFIHAKAPPPTPPPNLRRRSCSLPKDAGSGKLLTNFTFCPGDQTEDTASTVGSTNDSTADGGDQAQRQGMLQEPLKVLLQECSFNAIADRLHMEEAADLLGRPQFCLDEPLALDEAAFSFDPAPLTSTPTSMYTHPALHQWPWLSQSSLGDDSFVDMEEDFKSCRRPQFCIDEPLDMDEPGMFLEPAPLTETPRGYQHISTFRRNNESSVFMEDGHVGSIPFSKVQNTFIHSPLAPPTPLRNGACRRSQSLPRNVGSDKNTLEATCQALGCSSIPHVQERHSFVPPSPALTASPTYCNSYHHSNGEDSFPLSLSRAIEPRNTMSECSQQMTASNPPNVICLASLL